MSSFPPAVRQLFDRIRISLPWSRRAPEAGTITLTQKRIYTVPSLSGWMLTLVLLVLFITSTNYNLNLGFILTFTIAGIAFASIFQCFANLAFLELEAIAADNTFAGDSTTVRLRISNRSQRMRYAIWIGWRHAPESRRAVDIPPASDVVVELELMAQERGLQQIPMLALYTWFPLGLLRAWSYWYPELKAIIYPKPESFSQLLPFKSDGTDEAADHGDNGEFSGIRAYRSGDPVKHLAWKHIARIPPDSGMPLLTKEYSALRGKEYMLDLIALMQQLPAEQALSTATAWILQWEQQHNPYGLDTGETRIATAYGEQHARLCLETLALYGKQP